VRGYDDELVAMGETLGNEFVEESFRFVLIDVIIW
jgi:hypothetical protein